MITDPDIPPKRERRNAKNMKFGEMMSQRRDVKIIIRLVHYILQARSR